LAALWNRGIEICIAEKVDYVFINDADITIPNDGLRLLLERKKDVIAPMLLFSNSLYFRDTWAYRGMDGEEFTNRPPYHKTYKRPNPFQVKSVGMPLMTKAVIEAGARCDHNEVVGLCSQINNAGFQIFVDPMILTYHPREGTIVPPIYENL
jgi:hypothetical protein